MQVLQNRLRAMESYARRIGQRVDDRAERQELDELLKADAEYGFLRRLPLHMVKYKKGYRMICGSCTDKVIR